MNKDALMWKIINGEYPLPNAASMMGWKFLKYDESADEMHVEFDAKGAFTNPLGNIQGGMLSAMLDDTMGPALYVRLPPDKIAVTVEAKTNYISPAMPGRLIGVGRLEHLKGMLGFTSGKLLDGQGNVLATATATYRVSGMA